MSRIEIFGILENSFHSNISSKFTPILLQKNTS